MNAIAGLVPHAVAGHVMSGGNSVIIAVFALAAIVVSLPAGRLARHIPATALRRGFAVLVLLVAAGVATQAVTALVGA